MMNLKNGIRVAYAAWGASVLAKAASYPGDALQQGHDSFAKSGSSAAAAAAAGALAYATLCSNGFMSRTFGPPNSSMFPNTYAIVQFDSPCGNRGSQVGGRLDAFLNTFRQNCNVTYAATGEDPADWISVGHWKVDMFGINNIELTQRSASMDDLALLACFKNTTPGFVETSGKSPKDLRTEKLVIIGFSISGGVVFLVAISLGVHAHMRKGVQMAPASDHFRDITGYHHRFLPETIGRSMPSADSRLEERHELVTLPRSLPPPRQGDASSSLEAMPPPTYAEAQADAEAQAGSSMAAAASSSRGAPAPRSSENEGISSENGRKA